MSVLPPQHQRVGAHRARRNPVAATATAAAAAVALTALLLWGVSTTFFGGNGDTAQAGGSGAGDTATVPSTAGLEFSDDEPTGMPDFADEPPPPPVDATFAPPPPPPPVVDQAVSAIVLNGGVNVRGVAKGAAQQLVDAGWSGIDPEQTVNAADFPAVPATAVYYSDPALLATAEALVAALPVGTAQEADLSSYGGTTQLVVVLGSDYPVP